MKKPLGKFSVCSLLFAFYFFCFFFVSKAKVVLSLWHFFSRNQYPIKYFNDINFLFNSFLL